jgi:2-polyprenyl-3-methyl-5-hydroxy-6-metoxy-1,4-benzoquinol methylase
MNAENYMELYEAVYFFNRIKESTTNETAHLHYNEAIKKMGITESVYKAVLRILAANELLEYDGSHYLATTQSIENYQHILRNRVNQASNNQHEALFKKAIDGAQFFFDNLSDLEYDIYSRCDFDVTLQLGKEVAKHIGLNSCKVLELGGNSGGLATALLQKNTDCHYTVVDTKVPCRVGNLLNQSNQQNLKFIEGDVFDLKLPSGTYDHIIAMNLLHDFDDEKCLSILKNCRKYSDSNTKFVIIEDILTSDLEPKAVIMHGLRLSVECRGGKQRTVEELEALFAQINYKLESTIKINNVHTMLVMGETRRK